MADITNLEEVHGVGKFEEVVEEVEWQDGGLRLEFSVSLNGHQLLDGSTGVSPEVSPKALVCAIGILSHHIAGEMEVLDDAFKDDGSIDDDSGVVDSVINGIAKANDGEKSTLNQLVFGGVTPPEDCTEKSTPSVQVMRDRIRAAVPGCSMATVMPDGIRGVLSEVACGSIATFTTILASEGEIVVSRSGATARKSIYGVMVEAERLASDGGGHGRGRSGAMLAPGCVAEEGACAVAPDAGDGEEGCKEAGEVG